MFCTPAPTPLKVLPEATQAVTKIISLRSEIKWGHQTKKTYKGLL